MATPLLNSRQSFAHLHPLISRIQEELWIVALNSQLVPLETGMIFRGTVDSCPAHPRDILRFLIAHHASAFVMAHNHPTGSAAPSREDHRVTKRIKKLSLLLEVRMIDHLIIANNTYCSLADRGQL